MAQLYFRYSTMNAGKSIEVLKVCHNYEEQGKRVLLYTSAYDDRYGVGMVASRIGIQRKAQIITDDMNMYVEIGRRLKEGPIYCIVIDEAQFLEEHHVFELSRVVDDFGIPVICYGLKNDFRNKLFGGSEALLRYADKIEEVKTVCNAPDCNRKSTMILRIRGNGRPVYDGPQILIGGNESYKSVCRRHYYNPPEHW